MGTNSLPIPIAGNQSFSNVSNVSTQFSHLDVDNFKSVQADLDTTTISKELTAVNLTATTGNITNLTSTTITCTDLMNPGTLNVSGTATVVNENITNRLTVRGAPVTHGNARTEVLTNIATLNLLSNYDYSLGIQSFSTSPSTVLLPAPATAIFGDRIEIQYISGVNTVVDHILIIQGVNNDVFSKTSTLLKPSNPITGTTTPTNQLELCFNPNSGADLSRRVLTIHSSQNAGGAAGSTIVAVYMPDTATSTTGKWHVNAVSCRNGNSTTVDNSAFN